METSIIIYYEGKTIYDYCGWLKKETCNILHNKYPTITFYWKRGALLSGKIEMHWHYLSLLTTLIIQWHFIFNQIKILMKHGRNQMQVV